MAKRRESTPIVKVGFGIAVAAFVVIVALGFSGMTVPQPTPDSVSATVGCGSVFGPEEEPLCDEILAKRRNLMLAIGIPGVAVGLAIVVAGSRMGEGQR